MNTPRSSSAHSSAKTPGLNLSAQGMAEEDVRGSEIGHRRWFQSANDRILALDVVAGKFIDARLLKPMKKEMLY